MAQRGRYRKGEEREREILLAAIEVFAKGGYSASIREIAEAVGLTQPGLLHYFKSKEDLLVKVLEVRDEIDLGRDEDALVGLRMTIERNAQVDGLVRLFTTVGAQATSPEHVGHTYFRSRYDRGTARLVADITRRQESGEIRDDVDPHMLARLVLALVDGSQIQWLLDPEQTDMVAMYDQLIRLAATPAEPHPPA